MEKSQDKKNKKNSEKKEDIAVSSLIEHAQDIATTRVDEFSTNKQGQELDDYIEDIAETVRLGLDQSIAILTPWFFNNMPKIYYQTTPRNEKVRHLSSIITGHVFETKQTVELWDRAQAKVTYIGPGSDRKIIIAMASKLKLLEIKLGSLYFSRDNLLFLSTFFRKKYKPADKANEHILPKLEQAKEKILEEFPDHVNEVNHYIDHLDNDFLMYATVNRLIITFRMVFHMLSHEGGHTFLNFVEGTSVVRLTFGLKGVEFSEVLENILNLVHRYDFNIVRSFVVQFDEGYKEPINVIHIVMTHNSAQKIDAQNISVIKMVKALRSLGWIDSDDYDVLMKPPYLYSINAANLVRSIACWVHVLLGKENLYYYSEYKILQTFIYHHDLTTDIVTLFRNKFSPIASEQRVGRKFEEFREVLIKKIEEVIDRVERTILRESVKFIDHVLKTNYFLPTKTGLAFRIDPKVLDEKFYPLKPFGIFFITGRDYRFFQVRWKDISRGGLRVVMPKSTTEYSYALSGLFDEVYGLSQAQQLKNKDIPEGGSKAVLVLRPSANKGRSVRGAINALLDLLVSEDESHEEAFSKQVSYYTDEEIIYLGPDENMTNDLITWVTEQAQRRGYKYAKAFISSKPGEGINHKEYGVTSQGVHVFVHHMLVYLGINPERQKFTIKMTGGPDGDVAGNELKIIHREYGENARVVAIADGLGAAYDPNGLDWKELLELVHRNESIALFNPSKLSAGDDSFVIRSDTSENIRKRNELHYHALADIFIPAGGRPYTVNARNCNKFISEKGTPTCKAIVEGANIFFTKEARDFLQKNGIYMIKDSSANKTGVICSSFEIIASLLLSEEEFLEIKTVYVEQVIEILKQKADMEANMLFANFVHYNGRKTLVDLSQDLSIEINRITDTLLDAFIERKDLVLKEPLFQDIIYKHCPPILVEKYKSRIMQELPEAHKIAILAAYIASYVTYKEGLGWVDSMGETDRYNTVVSYMKNVQNAEKLISDVSQSDLNSKNSISEILRQSAARELTINSLKKQS